jgi:hypothetical protein
MVDAVVPEGGVIDRERATGFEVETEEELVVLVREG